VTVNFVKVAIADGVSIIISSSYCASAVIRMRCVQANDLRARYCANADTVIVANSAFSVRRTARANNTSTYALDGHAATLDEIRDRLRANGFDLDHNRFLILQGEVEQIATMKHGGSSSDEEGMLEYLEDIIGSSRLKPVLVQLQTRLDQMQQQRSEAVS
jgi:structural maintenance of chromosome 4